MGKYRNKKCEYNGEKFDSQRELNRYLELRLLERAGKISELKRQAPYVLAPAVRIGGRGRPALRYYADFVYIEDGKEIVEDTKGRITEGYRIKRHLMKAVHNIDIVEI